MINSKLMELINLWNKESYEFKTTIKPKFIGAVKSLRIINDDIVKLARESDTELDEVYKLMNNNDNKNN